MRRVAAFLAGLSLVALPALAQPAVPSAPPAAAAFEVSGFRHARFGMNEAEVRAAAAQDFPGATLQKAANPVERTVVLQFDLPRLEPGVGAVKVSYVLGATSHRLSHVNVVWATGPEPTDDERHAQAAAAIQLASYFQARPGRPKVVVQGEGGPNGVVLYAAADAKGAGVEVDIAGVGYRQGAAAAAPPPTGPAVLRVAYEVNVANPDLYRVTPDSF